MTSEKKLFGQEWVQKQLVIEEVKILKSIPTAEQIKEAGDKIKLQIAIMKAEHPAPQPQKKLRPTHEELRTEKIYFPQTRVLEGSKGMHRIMQKRQPYNMATQDPKDKLVLEEKKDWRRFHPKKNGWGPFHNLTRKEWSEKFAELCINSKLELSEWVDENPDSPEAEYFKRTILK